jgi:hypothetical protein
LEVRVALTDRRLIVLGEISIPYRGTDRISAVQAIQQKKRAGARAARPHSRGSAAEYGRTPRAPTKFGR